MRKLYSKEVERLEYDTYTYSMRRNAGRSYFFQVPKKTMRLLVIRRDSCSQIIKNREWCRKMMIDLSVFYKGELNETTDV